MAETGKECAGLCAEGCMSLLPYRDSKPQGAADFYYAINATFDFIEAKFGEEDLIRYWEDLGREYYRPVSQIWKEGGLAAVRDYWNDFFQAEPGAEVEMQWKQDELVLCVKTCPAITHLRNGGRKINKAFCRHCHHVSQAIGEPAGIAVRVVGGAGSCRQHFYAPGVDPAVENHIIEVT